MADEIQEKLNGEDSKPENEDTQSNLPVESTQTLNVDIIGILLPKEKILELNEIYNNYIESQDENKKLLEAHNSIVQNIKFIKEFVKDKIKNSNLDTSKNTIIEIANSIIYHSKLYLDKSKLYYLYHLSILTIIFKDNITRYTKKEYKNLFLNNNLDDFDVWYEYSYILDIIFFIVDEDDQFFIYKKSEMENIKQSINAIYNKFNNNNNKNIIKTFYEACKLSYGKDLNKSLSELFNILKNTSYNSFKQRDDCRIENTINYLNNKITDSNNTKIKLLRF